MNPVVLLGLFVVFSDAAKLRSWLGPTVFYDGAPPTQIYAHGFTSADTKLYVFGGITLNENNNPGPDHHPL